MSFASVKSSAVEEQTAQRETLPPAVVTLSVCIPTYNGEAFLREAIQSVLNQSFRNFELLLVDDGSTDATLTIARSFADPRIRVFENAERLGIPGNWNRCLALAQGEFFCLFHQDDVMLPENLARKVAVLTADPTISFVHSAVEFLVETDGQSPPTNWVEDAIEDFVVEGETYFRRLLFGNRICAPSVIVRRDKLLQLGEFDIQLGFACDYAMWLKLCVEGRVAFCSQPLLLYRWHGKNASHAYRFERGVDEVLNARRQALCYYLQRTGRREDASTLQAAIYALAEAERRAVALDSQSERQLAYIKAVEQLRDKLWADVQRVGKGWEEQQAYIQEQQAHIQKLQTYIQELAQVRDQLLAERERRLTRRFRRLARKFVRSVLPRNSLN